MPRAIAIGSLSKAYSTSGGASLTVLQDLTLDVEQHQVTSIVGPSGCGKTTLLRLISGLDSNFEGTIEFAPSLKTPERPPLGYMFQQDRLLPWRTVRENTLLGAEVSDQSGPETALRATDLLSHIGLSPFADYYPNQLSQGMRQRVAFARTILVNPQLLLLDEPFASVDYEIRLRLENYLLQRVRERQMTVVLVSHDLEEAIVLGQKVIVLTPRPGRVKRVYAVDIPMEEREALATRQTDEFRRQLGALAGEVLSNQ